MDGNSYKTIQIGKTIWMAENLKTTKFANGDGILYLKDDSTWNSTQSAAFCYYNHEQENSAIYGNLYNWFAVNDPRGLCPCGWEVASKKDFEMLSIAYGCDSRSGQHLKDISLGLWVNDSTSTNESGFSALPAGDRDEKFARLGYNAIFWNKEPYDGDACGYGNICAYECTLSNELNFTLRSFTLRNRGLSVRCVKKSDF